MRTGFRKRVSGGGWRAARQAQGREAAMVARATKAHCSPGRRSALACCRARRPSIVIRRVSPSTCDRHFSGEAATRYHGIRLAGQALVVRTGQPVFGTSVEAALSERTVLPGGQRAGPVSPGRSPRCAAPPYCCGQSRRSCCESLDHAQHTANHPCQKTGDHRRGSVRAVSARRLLRPAGARQVAGREAGTRAAWPHDQGRRGAFQSAVVQVRSRRSRARRPRRPAAARFQAPAGRFRAAQRHRSRVDLCRSQARGAGGALRTRQGRSPQLRRIARTPAGKRARPERRRPAAFHRAARRTDRWSPRLFRPTAR